MNFLIPFVISLLAGLSTVIGSLMVFVKIDKKDINKFIVFCLSMSLSIMLLISITELLPMSFILIVNECGLFKGCFLTCLFLLLGFILIYIVERYLSTKNDSELYKLGILNMIVLMIHNMPEGIATFMSSYYDINLGIKLAVSIILHNIPEGIAIAIPIYYATKNKYLGIKYALLSGLSEPLGAVIAFIFLKNYINDFTLSLVLIFVGGLMIKLALGKMYDEVVKYREKLLMIIGMFTGLIICILGIFLI